MTADPSTNQTSRFALPLLAGCVILDSKGRVLLIHRYFQRQQWETPGGKVHEGEDPGTTAARETSEELGIEIRVIRELGRQSFTEDGQGWEYVWHLADIVSGMPRPAERKLHDAVRYFSWSELRRMRGELSPNATNLVDAYLAGRLAGIAAPAVG